MFQAPESLLAECKAAPVHGQGWQLGVAELQGAHSSSAAQGHHWHLSPCRHKQCASDRRSGLHFLGLFGREFGQ